MQVSNYQKVEFSDVLKRILAFISSLGRQTLSHMDETIPNYTRQGINHSECLELTPVQRVNSWAQDTVDNLIRLGKLFTHSKLNEKLFWTQLAYAAKSYTQTNQIFQFQSIKKGRTTPCDRLANKFFHIKKLKL